MIAISQQAAPALSARRSVATRSTLSTARPAQRAKLGLSVKAMMGGNDGDRKKLTRESEPKARGAEEYWRSADEVSGKSPLQDPMAIAAMLGLIVPFTILGVGIATGSIGPK